MSGDNGGRVLITGASGLVGRRLAAFVAEQGRSLRLLARAPLDGPPDADCEIVRGDLRDPGALEAAVEGVELVLHCAAVFDFDPANPDELPAVNAKATEALVERAAKSGARRFVYVSTTAVYGRGDLVDVTEDCSPAPVGTYAETKWAGEQAVRASAGIEWVVLRPCAIYGPGEQRFLPFVAHVVRHERIPLLRGGSVLYDFVHVDDVCRALWLAATVPHAHGETFNVTEGVRRESGRIIEIFANALGVQARTVAVGLPVARAWNAVAMPLRRAFGGRGPQPFNPMMIELQREHRHFDIGHARELLGYDPARRLPEALAELTGHAQVQTP